VAKLKQRRGKRKKNKVESLLPWGVRALSGEVHSMGGEGGDIEEEATMTTFENWGAH